jgi:precorrin-2/cobalt-factor-2 C20-methyltransferase
MSTVAGTCYGVGVGPGDPELLTLKAVRALERSAAVAYFCAKGRASNARRVVEGHLRDDHTQLALVYPVTTEPVAPETYETLIADFYDQSAKRVAELLDAGADVAVLCEGDPLFFGSYMYLHERLRDRYRSEVIPGVSSVVAGAAAIGTPLAARNEVFTVLSGVLPVEELERRIAASDAVVVMKVGRNLEKVRDAVIRAGAIERASYVEWASLPNERVVPLADAGKTHAPYFSMVVIPGVRAQVR